MTYFTREDWGARPSKGGPGPLDIEQVEGVALHWPAMTKPLATVDAVKAALRGWQNYHMDSRGWSDIAYQEAYDQQGNAYELRGLHIQSGANGDSNVNERFGAILLVLAPGEQPSAAMVAAVREGIARHRALFPNSKRIVGHGQIREGGTQCPGPITQGLIDSGVFEPIPVGPTKAQAMRKAITKNIQQAKGWRKRVVDTLREARSYIPKDK